MKRFMVLAAWILLASPAWVWAENACGCGDKGDPKGNQPKGPMACPLFEVDVDYWYCDYYEVDCSSAPTVCYLYGVYDPAWECDPASCEAVRVTTAQKQTAPPPHVNPPPYDKQRPIKHGPGKGMKPAPVASPVLDKDQKEVFFEFPHPMRPSETVIAQLKQIDWGLVTPNGNPAPNSGKKKRFVVEQVDPSQATTPPVKIDTLGYHSVKHLVTKTDVDGNERTTCSVALEPKLPRDKYPFLLPILVVLNETLDCGQP